MLNALIESALRNRFLVLTGTLLIAGLGVYSALNLPIDAVPDLTNLQVQVITEAPALSPLEVETYLSFPVEGAMSGLPNVETIRSISKFGISVVTIVFHEGTDIYRARQLVGERLPKAAASIPPGYGKPTLGPITTALGEVFQFQIKDTTGTHTPMELRTLLDWSVAYQLRSVPGVTEINSHGGELKTYQVELDPDRLANFHLSMTDVFTALDANNANVGGGYLVREGEARYIRGESQTHSAEDIAAIVIDERNGVPVRVSDVASVHPAPMIRAGLVTRDGKGEIVTGLVMMLIGENSRRVVERVKEEIVEIQKTLPKGVVIEPLYDRKHLIDQTLGTVLKNLTEGGVLVIVTLLVLLGNLRGGVITAAAIPLSMLFAANIMLATGVTASLMSLGAIDFGMIVDSSVIMIENCVRRLAHEGGSRPKIEIIRDAAVEVRKPTMFGELIIAIVYLPILALQGTEGKMFRPMALTVIFALFGSMVLSLTLMPVLASIGLSSKAEEKEIWLIRMIKKVYEPILMIATRRPVVIALVALGLVAASVPVALNLGGEFMPKLNEGDLLIEAVRIPSAALDDAVAAGSRIEKLLKDNIPEVRLVYCKTGRPEIANDVMGVHQTDVWTLLYPQNQWRKGVTREDLIEQMDKLLADNVPGVKFGFSQPIEMRVNELVAGVKSDVAVLIQGPDLEVLRRKSLEVERVLGKIPGARDIKTPTTGRLPMLRVSVRRDQLARYGIKAQDVLQAISALGGTTIGVAFEGQIRHPIQIRLPLSWRNDPERIGSIRVVDPKGIAIPIRELADIRMEEGPSEIERENIQRRAVVGVNVRGRDIASFVDAARRAIEKEVTFDDGYRIRFGGQFEHLQTASQRLLIVVPIALLLILLLLYSTFHSLSLAFLISLAVPTAATGGVFALAWRGLPFSISAGVGFIALFGVAVLNGLVWVNTVIHLRKEGVEPHEAAREASLARLRPILMTALVAGLGFLPMATSTTPGAEIQRPLATVVIGGLVTSTLLTTLVLPAIYPWIAAISNFHWFGEKAKTEEI